MRLIRLRRTRSTIELSGNQVQPRHPYRSIAVEVLSNLLSITLTSRTGKVDDHLRRVYYFPPVHMGLRALSNGRSIEPS